METPGNDSSDVLFEYTFMRVGLRITADFVVCIPDSFVGISDRNVTNKTKTSDETFEYIDNMNTSRTNRGELQT